MRVIGWGATDVGRKRNHNEDSFLCNNEMALFAVADGMGGHLGGERASRLAVEILERELAPQVEGLRAPAAPRNEGVAHPAAAAMRVATQQAATAIHNEAQSQPERTGMGTTLT